MSQQRIMRSPIQPLEEDLSVKNSYADFCAGVNFVNGNVHVTFASVVADHSDEPATSRRVVSARVVLPISGILELQNLLAQLMDALAAQGVNIPHAPAPTVVTPIRTPR
jgi:hypothetical protein